MLLTLRSAACITAADQAISAATVKLSEVARRQLFLHILLIHQDHHNQRYGRIKEKLVIPGQIRAARALIRLSQAQLAEMVGISIPTVKRAESDHPNVLNVSDEIVREIQAALEGLGIEFLNSDEPGVRLKRKARRR